MADGISINNAVRNLIDSEREGAFLLPNIQRRFIWSEDQICRLFDSILREYPIGNLLIWKTNREILYREFIKDYTDDTKIGRAFTKKRSDRDKYLILDGQQRLQSLLIGLRGSYNGKELFFNILSGEVSDPEEMKFEFAFMKRDKMSNRNDFEKIWVSPVEIINEKKHVKILDKISENATRAITDSEKQKIVDHVLHMKGLFINNEIPQKIVDDTKYDEDGEEGYDENDIVEVFIRANDGGTKLSRSDLLFSLLSSGWEGVQEEMEDLLEKLDNKGFPLGRDFVLKTCLTLLGQKSRFDVAKFRTPKVREEMETGWKNITVAIEDTLDYVKDKTYIRSGKALSSSYVLIPLIYCRYKTDSRKGLEEIKEIEEYLLRSLLVGAFSGQPDQIIDECVEQMEPDASGHIFDVRNFFRIVREKARNLELTKDQIQKEGHGSKNIHLLFNFLYKDFDYEPVYEGNLPQVDHIFPDSKLKILKTNDSDSNKPTMMYRKPERNRLGNCMLLTRDENGPRGKRDKLPTEWFGDKTADYLHMHMIPDDKDLWEIENYEAFCEKREELIVERLSKSNEILKGIS